ncbi:enoyl-CoA hydratase/isomerase family protein [Pseudonocardia oroxyli]|uniref:enoyl-CoA hydratase/isomerase family protein n=1 Tax=Pseudonocardia oroxyli TaxID=366584 RepID=UPI0015A1CC46|nr:enoyl-CoA hydratase/isomerase family protein [Pseudonocardia oroxyli]
MEARAAGESSQVAIVVTENAVTVSFNNPARRNVFTPEVALSVVDALEVAASQRLPLVLRSAAPGMFVAGADLVSVRARTTNDSLDRSTGKVFDQLYDHPYPTVAVVDGFALGGGCELALACDFRISTPDARWGLPEVTLGLIPSAGGLSRLRSLVGESIAVDLTLTGRRISGAEAARIGLVQRLASAENLDEQLAALLHELSQADPMALRLAKGAMRVVGDQNRLVDAAAQALCIANPDAQARIEALLGK